MIVRTFTARTMLPASAREAYEWHARPGALERLNPAWDPVEVSDRSGGIEEGGRVVLRVGMGPMRVRWVAAHRAVEEGRRFVDEQVRGPFARWVHTHSFEPAGEDACVLEDRIEFALPLGSLGDLLGRGVTERRLRRLFAWRHEVTRTDLERQREARGDGPLRIAVTGSSGLIGRALVPFLTTGGHRVVSLVRRPTEGDDEIAWDPDRRVLDAEKLERLDAVVHLAGRGIAGGRWTDARKAAILRSRVEGTGLLCEALARAKRPPHILCCASAIGIYGDRGSEDLSEESAGGNGFLADVARAWEAAAEPATRAGIRVVLLRFGVVLSPAGGALAAMLPAFRFGAGGRVGSGRQYLSWIARDDVVGAVHFAATRSALSGAVNVVAPQPATSSDFARAVGRVLGRPAIAPLPAVVVRALFGEMGESLLLSSQRVRPVRLLDAGFRFRRPDLESALRFELGRPSAG